MKEFAANFEIPQDKPAFEAPRRDSNALFTSPNTPFSVPMKIQMG
jgi:hypothetical protein